MPIPNPRKGQKESEFMSRCMSDETMKKDFPDNKQRVAVCLTQVRRSKSKAANISDDSLDDFFDESFILY